MLIDLIVATEPSSMTAEERLRLASMLAAYLGIHFEEIEVISVTLANSSKVRIALPEEAAERLIAAFNSSDSLFKTFLDDIEVLDVQAENDPAPIESVRKVTRVTRNAVFGSPLNAPNTRVIFS